MNRMTCMVLELSGFQTWTNPILTLYYQFQRHYWTTLIWVEVSQKKTNIGMLTGSAPSSLSFSSSISHLLISGQQVHFYTGLVVPASCLFKALWCANSGFWTRLTQTFSMITPRCLERGHQRTTITTLRESLTAKTIGWSRRLMRRLSRMSLIMK